MATIIGSTMLIEGEIDSEERLVIQGTVQGRIKNRHGLEIARSGVVRADIDTDHLTISGQLNGSAQASARIEVTPEGRVAGDIRAPRVMIADGAHFKGNVDMDG